MNLSKSKWKRFGIFTLTCILFFILTLIVFACGGGGGGGGGGSSNPPGASAPTAVVQPLPLPGPYAVACSNVVQDFSRVGAGEDVTNYWEGMPSDNGMARYATDLLADPVEGVTVDLPLRDAEGRTEVTIPKLLLWGAVSME